MKTETLIELQRSITQGEWRIASDDKRALICGSGDFQTSLAVVSASLPQANTNATAIALVPELIAEVIRLREALKQCEIMLSTHVASGSPGSSLSTHDGNVNLLDMARAALVNDK